MSQKLNFDRLGFACFFSLIIFACGFSAAPAQEGLGSAGAFMRLGIGARAGSLGDAYVAAAAGPEAIYWNAAAVTLEPALQFAFTQRRYPFDRNFSFAGLTLPLSRRSAAGLSWTGFRTGGLEARTGNTQTPDELFSNDEHALSAAFGYRLAAGLYAGFTAKFISQKLLDRAATGYTAGTSFLFKPLSQVAFGLALQDLFSTFSWQAGSSQRLPSTLMLGLAWQFTPQMLMTCDYHHAGPGNLFKKEWWRRTGRVRAGTELRTLRSLPLRLGYSRNSFNAGAGFEIPLSSSVLALDYHYGVQEGLNSTGHAFSLRIDFGSRRRRAENVGEADFALQNKTATMPVSRNVAAGTWLTISSAKIVVRSGPGTNYKSLGLVYRNSRHEVLRQFDNWFQIRWNGNQAGWVQVNSVSRKKVAEK